MKTNMPSKEVDQHSLHSEVSNIVVLISMFLVSLSISLGLILHMGLHHVLAGVVGFSLFFGLTGFQIWQRSTSETQALKDEVSFLQSEIEQLRNTKGGLSSDLQSSFKPSETPIQTTFLDDKTSLALRASVSNLKENDVEKLQSRIKEMLTQVSAAEQARDVPEALPQESEKTPHSPTSIEKALESLRNAAQSLRPKIEMASEPIATESQSQAPMAEATLVPEGTDSSVTTEPPFGPDLKVIQQAISEGLVDVFLDPILSLGEHAAKHYEVSIALRNSTQDDLGSYESDDLKGSGVRPLVDCARFQRSAIIAERLATQGRKGSVFTHTRGETLLDPVFNELIQKDFSGRQSNIHQMVLCFTQTDIRSFRSEEQMAVTRLAGLGFRFAITNLLDLDMNFEAMSKVGFNFVKIQAPVLSQGLSYPQGHIQAREVTSYLTKFGFTLIVEDIDNEDTLARIYGYGAILGQGSLFGGRRPVRADLIARTGQAAA